MGCVAVCLWCTLPGEGGMSGLCRCLASLPCCTRRLLTNSRSAPLPLIHPTLPLLVLVNPPERVRMPKPFLPPQGGEKYVCLGTFLFMMLRYSLLLMLLTNFHNFQPQHFVWGVPIIDFEDTPSC